MSEWIKHDGGPCPVDGDTRVHFRTEWEMQKAETPVTEERNGRKASSLRWTHIGKPWDDIIAYRLVEIDQ